jgi:hypothetical protein
VLPPTSNVDIYLTADGLNYRVNKTERIKAVDSDGLSKTNLRGCKSPMIWKEIDPLDKDLLKELMDSGLLDFLTDKREQPAEQSRIY